MVFGTTPGSDSAAPPEAELIDPRTALERTITPALRRPPCLVSFSGGRDSSAVLAVATRLARREGLPDPVPATNIFPRAPASSEAQWQERVIDHLGLHDWIRLEHLDDLDLVGRYAQRVLRIHGLLWPANVHFHLPLLDAAQGGSLLTGVGGDELFAALRVRRLEAVRAGAVRPVARDVLRLGFERAPRVLRQARIARQLPIDMPWLLPRARRLATRLLAADAAAEPRRLDRRMTWSRTARYMAVGLDALELTARDCRVHLVHPLFASDFWTAAARLAPPAGFSGRAEAMRRLFGDVLPDETVTRGSKAQFDAAFWTERSRAFAAGWDGSGVPAEWVDPDALARHWRSRQPRAQSFTLLQAAWLASVDHGFQQSLDGAVELAPPLGADELQQRT
jgi:asparagine synthase (glutamine-hydrolysing)